MGAGYHGGFGATKGHSEGNPVAGEIVFVSEKPQYFINIAKRTDIDPDGLYDVVAHGSSTRIKVGDGDKDHYTPRELARILNHRKDYKKKGIRMLSCNTGDTSNGKVPFAQHLANKLNVVVWAPNYLVWAFPSGKHIVAKRLESKPDSPDLTQIGSMIPFYPGGKKK